MTVESWCKTKWGTDNQTCEILVEDRQNTETDLFGVNFISLFQKVFPWLLKTFLFYVYNYMQS